MKIIFLDIDGVLNSQRSFEDKNKDGKTDHYDLPHKFHVPWLNKIIKETDAKIVISSTWRIGTNVRRLADILYLCGVKGDVLDVTPRLQGKERGIEIAQWLKDTTYEIESFVILDDDRDMAHLIKKLVKTTWEYGLTENHANLAIEILNGGK